MNSEEHEGDAATTRELPSVLTASNEGEVVEEVRAW